MPVPVTIRGVMTSVRDKLAARTAPVHAHSTSNWADGNNGIPTFCERLVDRLRANGSRQVLFGSNYPMIAPTTALDASTNWISRRQFGRSSSAGTRNGSMAKGHELCSAWRCPVGANDLIWLKFANETQLYRDIGTARSQPIGCCS